MKYRRRLAAAALSLSMAFSAVYPAVPAFAAAWERNANGSYLASDGSIITGITSRGIDVSHWKQSIDWNAVAADDVQFVMLGTRYNNDVDPYFQVNATGAYNAGLRVGAYLYSYATTTEMAESEADFVLNLIKDYPISYPVVLDVEATEMNGLTPAQLSSIINSFCKKIENAGYYPMVYTNDYWLANKIDMAKVPYDVWVARYNAKPSYTNAAMWQATNEGQVNGISGNVDINFAFKDLNSKLPADRWRLINGQWYYYKNYVKQTGWINDGQSWYYMNSDGTQYKGWLLLENEYYYLLPKTGQMQTGWVQVDDKWYYMKPDGRMASEWAQVDGKYYYLLNGAMVTGWLRIGTDYYYMRGNGSMVTGWRKMDGAYYYFQQDGRLVRGWAQVDGHYYYMKSDGTMVTGWQTLDNVAYYFAPTGELATQWTQIDGSWYYFGTDGRMQTGWIQVDGRYYYLHTDGRMVTGWQSDGTNKYYMDVKSGKMAVGWKQIDNSWYYFNSSGHMLSGWLNDSGKYYYLNPSDGKMVSNGSYRIDNVNYTFDRSGVCQNETTGIDGGSVANNNSSNINNTTGTTTVTTGSPGGLGSSESMGSTWSSDVSGPGSSSTNGSTSAPGGNSTNGSTSGPGGNSTNGSISAPGGNSTNGNTSAPGGNSTNGSISAPGGNSTNGSISAPGGNSANGSTSAPSGNSTNGSSSSSGGSLKEYQTSGP